MDASTNGGPLALARQKQKLMSQLDAAVNEGGAQITMGNKHLRMDDEELRNGNFVDTFVLENMDPDSKAYHEELFGPVFNLFKVDSSKEALDLANKSDYGLCSTIFTDNLEKAEVAAKRLRTGTVFVNDCVASGSEYPSGGIKGSGYGRECFSDGLLSTANRKTIIRRDQQ